MKLNHKYTLIFLALYLVLKLIFWFFAYPNIDEAYYWLWGMKPSLSYHEHPPLLAWLNCIFYKGFGKSLFILRLPAFIGVIVTIMVLSKLLVKLQMKSNSLNIILLFLSTPLIFLLTSLAWHDSLLIALCLLSGLYFINYLSEKWNNQHGLSRDIYFAFLFLGLSALSKYNSVFLALAVLSVIITNRKLHGVFKDFRFYLGIIICLTIISPIFIWNLNNFYGSFRFNLFQRIFEPFQENRFFKGNYAGFIFGSIFTLSPMIWMGIIKSWKKNTAIVFDSFSTVYHKLAKQTLIFSSVAFLLFSNFSFILYYWNIVAYLFFLPLSASYLIKKRLYFTQLIYSLILNLIFVINYTIVPINVFSKGIENDDGPYHYGWKKIGNEILGKKSALRTEPDLVANSYGLASLMAYELNDTTVTTVRKQIDQFDYWNRKRNNVSKTLLILSDKPELNPELLNTLDSLALLDSISISKYGFLIQNYFIFSAVRKEGLLINDR